MAISRSWESGTIDGLGEQHCRWTCAAQPGRRIIVNTPNRVTLMLSIAEATYAQCPGSVVLRDCRASRILKEGGLPVDTVKAYGTGRIIRDCWH